MVTMLAAPSNGIEVFDNVHDLVDFEFGQEELYDVNNALLEMHLPLVESLVSTVSESCSLKISRDDLVSVGVYGLAKAIDEYEPGCGQDFCQFCTPCIKDSLTDAVRYASWVSRS